LSIESIVIPRLRTAPSVFGFHVLGRAVDELNVNVDGPPASFRGNKDNELSFQIPV
jgi:hypothetical protein